MSRQFGVSVVLWYSAQVVSGVFSDSQCIATLEKHTNTTHRVDKLH